MQPIQSLLFYHPPSKQTLQCAEGFCLDTVSPPGPQTGKTHDGDFSFITRTALDVIHWLPTPEENKSIFVAYEDNVHSVIILSIPINNHEDPCTLQLIQSGRIIKVMEYNISRHNTEQSKETTTTNEEIFLVSHG